MAQIQILPVFLLILCGCASPDPWVYHHIRAGQENYDSAKICYPTPDRVHGMDFEILQLEGKLYSYLQVHSPEIPPYGGNPKEALVYISVEGKKHPFLVYRHQGGQKVWLTEEVQNLVIFNLQQGKKVTLTLSSFSCELDPAYFPFHFKNLYEPPLRNPFQLPFSF